jgi:Kef-type K+ transport system membrane component KefB
VNLPALPLVEPAWLFALLALLILVVPLLSERFNIPSTVGLIVAGALVGPGALQLMVREGAVGTLGSVGLLYLIFMAGVELDLDQMKRQRRDSLVFGGMTFLIPMLLGFGSALALGFSLLPAILIASCWASHTLLAYPIFRRHGLVAARAVNTGVGGTILTDTAALLVLVIVVRAADGHLNVAFWLLLAAGTVAVGLVTLLALPRIGRWFFGFAPDAGVRFAYILAALFGAAALANLAGLEPILGAFMAGLGLNRLVPNGSRLMERIEFLGLNFLTPIFLISVGLLIDVRVLMEPRTLLMAGVFTLVAVGGKAMAAAASGKLLGYSRDEASALFALSNAQAAATLAAIVVGLRAGLIGPTVLNAAILVILVSCLLASFVAARVAPRLVRPAPRRALGSIIVLPVVRPEAAGPMVRLAAALAHADGGLVLPLTIAPSEAGRRALEAMRRINEAAESLARAAGVEAEGILRIDASPADGVSRTVRERSASLVLLGWHGPDHAAMFVPRRINPVLADARAPVLLAHLDERTPERVLLVVPHVDLTCGGMDNLRLAAEAARRAAAVYRCPVEAISCVNAAPVLELLVEVLQITPRVDARPAEAVVRDAVVPTDLLVVPARADDLELRGPERLCPEVGAAQMLVAVGGGRQSISAPAQPDASEAPAVSLVPAGGTA